MQHSIPADHARHDLELIAGHAAGDLTDPERIQAEALLATCTHCAELRRDLLAIASATRALPAPRAPRDYRLTETQAAGLRRGGWLRGLLRPFAAPRSTARPVALAFTSLGLAGLLVANILPAMFGSAGAALAPQAERGGLSAEQAATAAPAGSAAALPLPAVPGATDSRNGFQFGPAAQPTAALDLLAGGSKSTQTTTRAAAGEAQGSATGQPSDAERVRAAPELFTAGTNPLVVGSVVLLAIGLALFALRFIARRVG